MIEGGVLNFKVVAKNKFGTVLSVSDAAVSLSDASFGSVAVAADGTGGVFQSVPGVVGQVALVATAAGIASAPFLVDVTPDQTVATVEIVPEDAVATVEIVPAP